MEEPSWAVEMIAETAKDETRRALGIESAGGGEGEGEGEDDFEDDADEQDELVEDFDQQEAVRPRLRLVAELGREDVEGACTRVRPR